MRTFPVLAHPLGLALGLAALVMPALAADMPEAYFANKAPRVAAGQCSDYLSRPITTAMLPAMHTAGCCDVLVKMADGPAVEVLERRLACPNWHAYRTHWGQAPTHIDLESLAAVDTDEVHMLPPPPGVVAPPAPDPDPVAEPDPPAADPPPDEEFTIQ